MQKTDLLKGKKIILGVTASISAYKSPILLRELIKLGADVQVMMTKDAVNFVSPNTLSNLSGKSVIIEQFDDTLNNKGAWHVKLANECDALLIAPLSANTLSKIANGLVDNALLTVLFSIPMGYSPNQTKKTPVVLSPAMDYDMWYNPIIQENIQKLSKYGYAIIEPEEGELSSGLIGKGRLPEYSVIVNTLLEKLSISNNDSHKSNSTNIKVEFVTKNEVENKINGNAIEEIKVDTIKVEEVSENNTKENFKQDGNSKLQNIQSKIKELEAKLNLKAKFSTNLNTNTNIYTNDVSNDYSTESNLQNAPIADESIDLELLKLKTQEILIKPIESISETIEKRQFDVELELEELKKKVIS